MLKPVLVFDFDNTLTRGDILDQVVETFSPNDRWKHWESEWVAGRLPARECLRLQVENLRVTREALLDYLLSIRIDSAFKGILAWAKAHDVEVLIVSDSFLPIIRHILANNAIDGVPVFANDLEFSGDQLHPAFPFHDPAFPRSANAKANHLVPYRGNTIVYAGDGRSDLDAALVSDVVFAKDSLARELEARSVPFQPFTTLEPMLAYLESLDSNWAQADEASVV
ncbi:MAG: MtnX-like HAD-IB family phosphatase [Betaproteobacteria bacterium]